MSAPEGFQLIRVTARLTLRAVVQVPVSVELLDDGIFTAEFSKQMVLDGMEGIAVTREALTAGKVEILDVRRVDDGRIIGLQS